MTVKMHDGVGMGTQVVGEGVVVVDGVGVMVVVVQVEPVEKVRASAMSLTVNN